MSYSRIEEVKVTHSYQCDGCKKVYESISLRRDGHVVKQTREADVVQCFEMDCPWSVGEEHESEKLELHACSRECLMQAVGEIIWPPGKEKEKGGNGA